MRNLLHEGYETEYLENIIYDCAFLDDLVNGEMWMPCNETIRHLKTNEHSGSSPLGLPETNKSEEVGKLQMSLELAAEMSRHSVCIKDTRRT